MPKTRNISKEALAFRSNRNLPVYCNPAELHGDIPPESPEPQPRAPQHKQQLRIPSMDERAERARSLLDRAKQIIKNTAFTEASLGRLVINPSSRLFQEDIKFRDLLLRIIDQNEETMQNVRGRLQWLIELHPDNLGELVNNELRAQEQECGLKITAPPQNVDQKTDTSTLTHEVEGIQPDFVYLLVHCELPAADMLDVFSLTKKQVTKILDLRSLTSQQ